MGVSLSVLASGSRGNSAIVASVSTRILVDAGISCREIFKRMKAAGDDPHRLSAILITHEHSDHVYGLADAGQETESSGLHDRGHAPCLGASRARTEGPASRRQPSGSVRVGAQFPGGRHSGHAVHHSARRRRSGGLHLPCGRHKNRLCYRPRIPAGERARPLARLAMCWSWNRTTTSKCCAADPIPGR